MVWEDLQTQILGQMVAVRGSLYLCHKRVSFKQPLLREQWVPPMSGYRVITGGVVLGRILNLVWQMAGRLYRCLRRVNI